ncbi:MAG: HD domain-containing protein [Acidimicrobiales bacterium]
MSGTPDSSRPLVFAHREQDAATVDGLRVHRVAREEREERGIAPGATRAVGAGSRLRPEEPDRYRTCFERDRDRVLHSAAFRRLAGKTQVFVHPEDHQRTRLTHALEVAQIATAIGRSTGLNAELLDAMALAHDIGHGPAGHTSETALEEYVPGFHHATWGADVVLGPLNLCRETLDGVRCHSWSLPGPSTPEGHVLSWADRIAYCTHDFEDAAGAGVVSPSQLPAEVAEIAGRTRGQQVDTFLTALVDGILEHGMVAMPEAPASALRTLRSFNYERIYMRPASVAQGRAVVSVLRALVDYFAADPSRVPSDNEPELDPLLRSVAYVAGMTDRFAFRSAVELLGWPVDKLPMGIDSPYAGLGPAAAATP